MNRTFVKYEIPYIPKMIEQFVLKEVHRHVILILSNSFGSCPTENILNFLENTARPTTLQRDLDVLSTSTFRHIVSKFGSHRSIRRIYVSEERRLLEQELYDVSILLEKLRLFEEFRKYSKDLIIWEGENHKLIGFLAHRSVCYIKNQLKEYCKEFYVFSFGSRVKEQEVRRSIRKFLPLEQGEWLDYKGFISW